MKYKNKSFMFLNGSFMSSLVRWSHFFLISVWGSFKKKVAKPYLRWLEANKLNKNCVNLKMFCYLTRWLRQQRWNCLYFISTARGLIQVHDAKYIDMWSWGSNPRLLNYQHNDLTNWAKLPLVNSHLNEFIITISSC